MASVDSHGIVSLKSQRPFAAAMRVAIGLKARTGRAALVALAGDVHAPHSMFRFYSGVKKGFQSGRSEDEIRKSLDLSSWSKLERSYVIGRNINRAYLEIEAASFDD